MPVSVRLLAPARAGRLPRGRHALAWVRYGGVNAPAPGRALAIDLPLRQIGPPRIERWDCASPPARGRLGALRWAAADGVLAFSLRVAQGREPLEKTAARAYREMLAGLAAAGHPEPLRLWHYLPAINADERDLERYRRFCLGRHEALRAANPGLLRRLPAASALGCARGKALLIYGIAAREPGCPIENPRQLPAFRYPRRYGPRPPSFSRAMRSSRLDPVLQISGTAAIAGHASLHPGDAAAQFDETLRNLEAVRVAGMAARLRGLKIYLRDPALQPALCTRLARALPGVPALWLRADICRGELLLEIDAFAG